MDTETIETYRSIIKRIFIEYASIPYAHGDVETQTVFDTTSDHYLLMLVGRENYTRVHGCLVHLDIINGKIWIQRDGMETGIANELLDAGVPKEAIVLGYLSPESRVHTEFAVE